MASLATRDGRTWVPSYLDSIDQERCIGCGRCFKVCGRGVMEPGEKEIDVDEDDDEYGEEAASTVMTVADAGACIGCEACAKVCSRKAQSYVAA